MRISRLTRISVSYLDAALRVVLPMPKDLAMLFGLWVLLRWSLLFGRRQSDGQLRARVHCTSTYLSILQRESPGEIERSGG